MPQLDIYPNAEDIEIATHTTLARWYRFLRSPANEEERALQARMIERFNEFGGWNPALSKTIGWD